MGYKIIYPQIGKRNRSKYQKPLQFSKKSIVFGAIFVLMVILTIWQGGLLWLLPGDPEVTRNALQTMIDSLSDGETLGEAVATFCREVVAGAQ